jgi:hypothetical protein
MDWTTFLNSLLVTFKPYLLTLVGLIVLDVMLGVASGLKSGTFQWRQLADFYKQSVVPGLMGWIGLTIATYLVMPSLLGASADVLSQVTATVAWGTVVATLLSSIVKSATELYSLKLPTTPPVPPAAKTG